ncbi:hypothetical protein [Neptuniibacter sp. QD37_11]|uniref:hypothetical protein n=1 Tax=Neptuniibacter sp. QD37_11 TaxID=3398209 RepID=UPI0039F45BBC
MNTNNTETNVSPTLYADRDEMALDQAGEYYSRHVVAMAREKLEKKADIAAELGYRDHLIDEGVACLKALQDYIKEFGKDADPEVIQAECGEAILRLTGQYAKESEDTAA